MSYERDRQRLRMWWQGSEDHGKRVDSFALLAPVEAKAPRPGPTKKALRESVDDAHAAFWAKGGEITKLPPGKPPK